MHVLLLSQCESPPPPPTLLPFDCGAFLMMPSLVVVHCGALPFLARLVSAELVLRGRHLCLSAVLWCHLASHHGKNRRQAAVHTQVRVGVDGCAVGAIMLLSMFVWCRIIIFTRTCT